MQSSALEKKKELIQFFLKRNILVDPQILLNVPPEKIDLLLQKLSNMPASEIMFYSTNLSKLLENNETVQNIPSSKDKVKVISSFADVKKKRDIQDFIAHFNNRYNSLKRILQSRMELQNATSISRILAKKDKENISCIGLVLDKQETKNGNLRFTIEDPTGTIGVIVGKSKADVLTLAKDVQEDEVIGITGMNGDKIIFANNIILPDVPLSKEFKKAPEEEYAIFLGDMHFGSKVFIKDSFEKMIKWLNLEIGSDEQKEIVKKIKYLFIAGDLVEGVGVYPGHELDLEIQDIVKQYELFAEFLKRIPKYITMIVCPGNHDAMRMAEPQPALSKEYAAALHSMDNIVFVTNPAIVNIASTKNFPGMDVLIYHGFSFPYLADKVESIRVAGGQKRVDLILTYLLQRRHLAPPHASTLYVPNPNLDPLVIESVPDFLVSGHIHRTSVSKYRNVTLLNCSCWLEKTDYQEKVGLDPEPARVIIANLQTRDVRIMKF